MTRGSRWSASGVAVMRDDWDAARWDAYPMIIRMILGGLALIATIMLSFDCAGEEPFVWPTRRDLYVYAVGGTALSCFWIAWFWSTLRAAARVDHRSAGYAIGVAASLMLIVGLGLSALVVAAYIQDLHTFRAYGIAN